MTENALSIFEGKGNLPAHVANFFGDTGGNIDDRMTVPSLSFKGKVWTIGLSGEKTKLMKRDSDGDEVPLGTMKVVVLDYAKRRGRAYYEGAYDPDKEAAPLCWSDDGIAPDKSINEPQSSKCDTCPMSVKGSKVSDNGKAVTACAQHRMLVVVPANKLDFQPLRMKIAITSDWDKQSPDLEAQNWYGFNNYTDFLRANGCSHTAALVTKMKFDSNVAYPKIIFSPDRWLSQDEMTQIKPVVQSDEVAKLISGSFTPAGSDGKALAAPAETEEEPARDIPDPTVAKAAKAAAAKEAKSLLEKQQAALAEADAAKKKAAASDDDDDEAEIILPGQGTQEPMKEAKKVEDPKPKASAEVPKDVADLLAEWGDD